MATRWHCLTCSTDRLERSPARLTGPHRKEPPAMATRKAAAPVSAVMSGDKSVSAPSPVVQPTLAETLAACQSADSRLATLTLAIHTSWTAFDKATKAYDKARVSMVTAGVVPARIAAQLIQHAEANKLMLAERGPNAGKPAVMHLATHLGYERRRFEPIHKAALALLEAKVTLAPEAPVTPEDLEIVGPHLSKDAKRQAAKAAEKKAAETAGTPAVTDPDQPEENDAPAPAPEVGYNVTLADVLRQLEMTAKIAETFAASNGITRESMDNIQDVLASISETLESVVSEK
ncbi:hypothetical protein SEA_PUREGLOBE5_127 [Arthrobacter phage Pureglobe5]|nr:hypothetical protein SEA_PUREGLOBE5_127 [Arthrobacter phage Pureglobe5]